MASGQNAAPNFVDQQLQYEQSGLTNYGDPNTTGLDFSSAATASSAPASSVQSGGVIQSAGPQLITNVCTHLAIPFYGQYNGSRNPARGYLAIQNQDASGNYCYYLPNFNGQYFGNGGTAGIGLGVAIPPGQLYEIDGPPINQFVVYFLVTTSEPGNPLGFPGMIIEGTFNNG